jgi:hypothetical protein
MIHVINGCRSLEGPLDDPIDPAKPEDGTLVLETLEVPRLML